MRLLRGWGLGLRDHLRAGVRPRRVDRAGVGAVCAALAAGSGRVDYVVEGEVGKVIQKANPCKCEPRCQTVTEFRGGVEFIKYTWCKTPQPWNASGSWLASDPEVEARVLAGIKAAVPNWEILRKETRRKTSHDEPVCQTFWGSHGCSLPENHVGMCVCASGTGSGALCSAIYKLDQGAGVIWWNDDDEPSTSVCVWWK